MGLGKYINKISRGFVIGVVPMAMLIMPTIFNPQNPDAYWKGIATYVIAFLLISVLCLMSKKRIIEESFNEPFIQTIHKTWKVALISMGSVWAIGFLSKGAAKATIKEALNNLSFAVILTQAFVVAAFEEFMFRLMLPKLLGDKIHKGLKYVILALLFCLFHLAVKQGDVWATLPYFPLSIIWQWIRDKYGIAHSVVSHGFWNLGILGFNA